MKHTLKYTFSVLILLVSLNVTPQETGVKDSIATKKDSVVPKKERFGIRFGADLFKLTRSFYEKNYRGIELVGDFKLTRRHYIAVELGNENKTVDDDRINFTTQGTYIKAGFDFNAYENWRGMENMIYVGLRYGVSSFSQQRNSYEIYNRDTYFGVVPEIIDGEKFSGLSAQWIEVVAGFKAEVYKNIYLGISLRVNRLMSNKQPENFDNLYIPGFNRTYNGDFGVGFNYTVSYFLPLYKTTIKAKEKKK
jgi:Domain of unknown function (DUF6048)